MSKPRLLDLFCGAGGATKGYQRAGFYVVGVDIKPQPRYCGDEFVQADAMTFPLSGFDAIHASPPCQAYSRLRHLPWLKGREYPALLAATRERLQLTDVPWVIENVEDAPMPYSVVLCGVMFGLPVYRHRRFGASFLMLQPEHMKHEHTLAAGRAAMATRYRKSAGVTGVIVKEISRGSLAGHATGAKETGRLMGIDWMRRDELTQAIPPAYTEWVGRELLRQIKAVA
jgi:DNA (cytosine-5)-methyltransferase 1